MTVTIGPALQLPPQFDDSKLDTSFRVLVDYHIATDTHLVRMDLLKSGVQMNTGFHVRRVRSGGRVGGDELVMPNHYPGFAVQASSGDLITALRGMADRLEQQVKDDAEKSKP